MPISSSLFKKLQAGGVIGASGFKMGSVVNRRQRGCLSHGVEIEGLADFSSAAMNSGWPMP